jgi:hypothetical protein
VNRKDHGRFERFFQVLLIDVHVGTSVMPVVMVVVVVSVVTVVTVVVTMEMAVSIVVPAVALDHVRI